MVSLTDGPAEVFALADVWELENLLPLLAFALAFPSAPCRDGEKEAGDYVCDAVWGPCLPRRLPSGFLSGKTLFHACTLVPGTAEQ